MLRDAFLPACCALSVACHGGPATSRPAPAAVTDGREVVAAMHDRYADTWYRTLRFKQTVVRTAADGTASPGQVWLEHAELPGKLRIDLGEAYNGNGVIYAGDSLFVFREGQLTRRAQQRNVLLVLGFDVYRQPVSESLAVLGAQGFDLTRVHRDTWQGRPVWVVGAEAGDLHTRQFWVDRERMLFVRVIQPAGADGSRTSDVRFEDYRPLGQAWISARVVFLTDGKEMSREEYFDIEANPTLPPGLFDPAQWGSGGAVRSEEGRPWV